MHRYAVLILLFSVVLFFAAILTTELIRRQVHEARYGSRQISPWDNRYVGSVFGRFGIWTLHKQVFLQSRLREFLVALVAAWAISLAAGTAIYLCVRQ